LVLGAPELTLESSGGAKTRVTGVGVAVRPPGVGVLVGVRVGVLVGVDVACGSQAPRVQMEQDAPDWVVQSREPRGQTTERQLQLVELPAQSTGWLAPLLATERQLALLQAQMVVGVGVLVGVLVGPADWTITSWG